eukprot:gene3717-4630_t
MTLYNNAILNNNNNNQPNNNNQYGDGEEDLNDSVRSTNPLLVGVGYEHDLEEQVYVTLDKNYHDNSSTTTSTISLKKKYDTDMDPVDLEKDYHHQQQPNNNNNFLTASSNIFTPVSLHSPNSQSTSKHTHHHLDIPSSSSSTTTTNNTPFSNISNRLNPFNNFNSNINNNNNNNKNNNKTTERITNYNNSILTTNTMGGEDEEEEEEDENGVPKSPIYVHKAHSSQISDDYLSILKASYSVVQKKKKAAVALKVGRKWLTNIIIVQTVGNLIRALPIFILEKYYVMLLIFFQALFLVIGSYGVKRLKKYLILLYVIGCFGTTILDLIMTFTYAHSQSSRPFNERQFAFWSYVLFVALLCTLNIIGGILLGLKLFVSVVTLKDPTNNSLVLLAASLVGSFETSPEEEEESKNNAKKTNRCIYFYGSDVKKALATTTSLARSLSIRNSFRQSIKQIFNKKVWGQSSSVTTKASSHILSMTSNQVITSKYNFFTFLPKVIFFQFSRLANLYTLCIVILCMFSFSPVSPVSSFTPLVVVISVSCFKELAEDIKRHRQDKEINHRSTWIYRPPFYDEEQENLKKNSSAGPKLWNIITRKRRTNTPGGETATTTRTRGNSMSSTTTTLRRSQSLESSPSKKNLKQNLSDVGIYQKSFWKDIKAGDIIKVQDGDLLPADIICLSSSRPDGRAYVETANLDGETNLKIKNNISRCSWIRSPEDLDNFSCKVDYEGPNNDIYGFEGVLTILKEPETSTTTLGSSTSISKSSPNFVPVTIDSVLLRGTKLRNTDWIIGIVVYTGVDTKVEKNSTKVNQKRSSVERGVNNKLLMLFLLQTIICIVCSIGHNRWHLEDDKESKPWYMGIQSQEKDFIYISYVILYNTLIPLSMYVSMEVIRVSNAHFIDSDLEMYDEKTDTPAQARNTNINEELGQIQYLFSDKTGTLTCNEMVFNRCSVGGVIYGPTESSLNQMRLELNKDVLSCSNTSTTSSNGILLGSQSQYLKEFFTCLAICNTVIIEKTQEGADLNYNPSTIPNYQSASPDEEALTLTAAKYGIVLKSKEDNIVTVQVNGKDERYEILNLLEFNSYRKRMSVIVRTEQGQIRLYCKGADSVIFQRTEPGSKPLQIQTEQHLSNFASNGLRTLCMAMKTIDTEQYHAWNRIYQDASVSLNKKAEKIDQACELIETDLSLIGATGIEDRLQDQVPETIQALREAGIKVWVLTGDKQETAISIATSSSVISNDMEIIILNETKKEELMKRLLHISEQKNLYRFYNMKGKWGPKFVEKVATKLRLEPSDAPKLLNRSNYDNPQHIAIIIDGTTLQLALEPELRYYFLQVAKTCESVVCCRCSPSQKAKVVNLMAERSFLFGDGAITMSIGDGANDVPMIQKAHVGVGISGREGMQAVLASDFAIANFSMLKRLLLVHGNRSYKRMTKLILYSFSKNIALSITQFWFGFFSGFSGQMIYFDFLFTLYNALFTSLPVLTLGTFDQDTKEQDLLNQPRLYRICQTNKPFSTAQFFFWVFIGIWQSATIFLVTFFVLQTATVEGGKTLGLWSIGTAAYIYLVITVNLQISLITRYWTRSNIWTTSASILASFAFVALYSALYYIEPEACYILFELFTVGEFWLLMIIVPLISLLPFILVSLNKWIFTSNPTENYYATKQQKHGFIQMQEF